MACTGHAPRRRALIVEDEALIAMLLEGHLRRLGYGDIAVAGSFGAALTLVAPDLDLAVLDINLGGKLSYPVAEALINCGVPLLFSTAYPRACPGHLADVPVLSKPFTRSALNTAVLSVTATPRDDTPPEDIVFSPLTEFQPSGAPNREATGQTPGVRPHVRLA